MGKKKNRKRSAYESALKILEIIKTKQYTDEDAKMLYEEENDEMHIPTYRGTTFSELAKIALHVTGLKKYEGDDPYILHEIESIQEYTDRQNKWIQKQIDYNSKRTVKSK